MNQLIYSFLKEWRLRDEANDSHYFTDANLKVACGESPLNEMLSFKIDI